MNRFVRTISNRWWLPGVLLVTAVFAVPQALDAIGSMSRISRSAGVGGWQETHERPPLGSYPIARFRWTKPRAVVREVIAGTRLQIPLNMSRPDIETKPVTVAVSIDHVHVERLTLVRNGWHVLTFDVMNLLGEGPWQSQTVIKIVIEASPAFVPAEFGSTTDRRTLGVGLGDFVWSGPAPPSFVRRPSQ